MKKVTIHIYIINYRALKDTEDQQIKKNIIPGHSSSSSISTSNHRTPYSHFINDPKVKGSDTSTPNADPSYKYIPRIFTTVQLGNSCTLLDTEMVKLQRSGKIKYFYYPALSYLNMEDAKKGVHAIHMDRDMKKY